MFNLQTADVVVAAARLVRKGAVFAMNWEQEKPNPPLFGRGRFRHTVYRESPIGHHGDDVLDNFFTQASSQWDGLTHVGDFEHGFWGGVTNAELRQDKTRLGIDHWARRGLVGRAVVFDVERWRAAQGRPLNYRETDPITVADMEGMVAAQKIDLRPGDVWILHMGWVAWYETLNPLERRVLATTPGMKTPGLDNGEAMAEWIFDRHPAAICADNPALEAWPPPDFRAPDGFLHHWILGRFGMAIGEMWQTTHLAADCAADGVYEGLFTSAPLNVQGGTGSPPNALVIK